MASANPFDAPVINPNLLATDADLAVMREAIKTARDFVAAPAWSDWIIAEYGAFAEAQTDDELNAYIRANGNAIYHPVGTVAMGSALESDLRVKGTKGLRVVDASAFVSASAAARALWVEAKRVLTLVLSKPFIPSGHTQGPTYILAERAAALVRESLKASQ